MRFLHGKAIEINGFQVPRLITGGVYVRDIPRKLVLTLVVKRHLHFHELE
jgi:hypothetical protein